MLSTYKTILSQKIQLNSETYLFHFNLMEPKEIKFSAGQYLIIKIPTDKSPVSRLYSVASSAAEKSNFDLIIQIIPDGLASSYLSGLKVKDEVIFQGPAGLFGLKENGRSKIFLTTGTGIAPIKSMLESYQLPVDSYSLFWGLKSFQDVYLFNKFRQFNPKICLSREQNLDIVPEVDRIFFKLGHIDAHAPILTTHDYYLCGGRKIVESLRLFLINKGVLLENIYFEKF